MSEDNDPQATPMPENDDQSMHQQQQVPQAPSVDVMNLIMQEITQLREQRTQIIEQNKLMQQEMRRLQEQQNDIQRLAQEADVDKILRKETSRFMDEAKCLLPNKCRITFNGNNFDEWRIVILSDAHIIGASDVLVNHSCSPNSNMVERALWEKKSIFMKARMINSVSLTVLETVGYFGTAAQIWDNINDLYGMSRAEERFRTTQELFALKLKGNDYLTYKRTFQRLQNRLQNIGFVLPTWSSDDLFNIGLGDWKKDRF